MKFRKLLLCFFAGIVLTSFANVYTYAAEEDNIVTEDTTVQDTMINTAADSAAVNDNTNGVNDTANTDTTVTDDQNTDVILENTTDVPADEVKDDAAELKAAEEKKAAAEKAAAKEAKKKAAKEVKYSKADLRLLSALIYCEANGEAYNGKLAVGIVVLNRKRSGSFPDTVKGVIYQKYQFGPASNGSLKKALDQYDNGKFDSDAEKGCIKAAKEALSETTSITVKGSKKNFSKYLYFSGSLRGNTYSLGNHEFK
ncbi:MAG: cell wall hydrolase [Anaerocolumna sp.]